MKKLLFFVWAVIAIVFAYLVNFNSEGFYGINDFDGKVDFDDTVSYDLRKNIIEQEIVVAHNSFDGVAIYFEKPGERFIFNDEYYSAYFRFELYEGDKYIDGYSVEYAFPDDGNDRIRLRFPEIRDSAGKTYRLKIYSYHDNGFTADIKLAKKTSSDYGRTLVNGEESEYGIYYSTYYQNHGYKMLASIVTIIVAIVTIITALCLLKVKKLENIYFVIALVVGVMLTFIARPYYGSDEGDHLARIYSVSNGFNLPPRSADEGWPVVSVPVNLSGYYMNNYKEIAEKINSETNGYDYFWNNMEYTGVYSPFSYIIQVPIMWLSRIITNKPVLWIYMMRLGQLIICAFLIREIIKRTLVGQKLIFIVALLPASICAITFASADAVFSVACFALVSEILSIIKGGRAIDKKSATILWLSAFFVAIGKLMFFPLIFLLYLIPMETKLKKDYKKITLMIVPILAVVLIWNLVASPLITSSQGVNSGHQIAYYFSNPIELFQVLVHSFFNSFGNHLSDLFGGKNGWHGSFISDGSLLPIIFAVLTLYVIFSEKIELSKKQRTLVLAILVVELLCIMMSLLLVCMPPYAEEIVGIHGRYFAMLIPLFALLVARKGNQLKYNAWRYIPSVILLCYMIYIFRLVLEICWF